MTTLQETGKLISGFRIKALAFTAIIMFVSGLGAVPALAQSQRVVSGKVLTAGGDPQPNAVVYLENDRTKDIKTFFSVQDGSYRFGQLSPDVDYEVWAEYQGKKSQSKTISSFDSRKTFVYDLKLSK